MEDPPSLLQPTLSSDNAESLSSPLQNSLLPSLRGTMSYIGGVVHCKGRWAMTDQAHEIDGQTSDFEFKLIKADENSGGLFPVNGKYQGWFSVRQPPPMKSSVKVDDKDMLIRFDMLDNGNYSVTGKGFNKFGSFSLSGTLQSDGKIQMYRSYYQITTVPTTTSSRKSQVKKEKEPVEIAPTPKKIIKDEEKEPLPPTPLDTPRESGRVRKQSSLLREYQESLQKPISKPMPQEPKETPRTAVSAIPSVSERSHRLPTGLKKCGDLLKDISKHPRAFWFLEPVDHIKLNIPDYPKIIKHPMDFSTIKDNLEQGIYSSVDGFAEHMRLVFRNAITYNTAPDSAVNMAAKEISSKFEEKFKNILSQLEGNIGFTIPEPSKPLKTASAKKPATKVPPPPSPREVSTPRTVAGRPSLGSRVPPVPAYIPPAAIDIQTQTIVEMQKSMEQMKEELNRLRTMVKENEIVKKINDTKEAALNPLSFDEKKTLVEDIHKLPKDKIDIVATIIKEALPDCDDSEISLDALDTLTLRKLQKFVRECGVDTKKRKSTDGISKAKGDGNAPKRQRKPKALSSNASTDALSSNANPQASSFEAHEELLFEDGSLEEMDVVVAMGENQSEIHSSYQITHSGQSATNAPHSNEEDDDDEGNDWSEAAAEMRA